MISNSTVRAEIARSWDAIRRLTHWHRILLAPNGMTIIETPPEELSNLPLVLAYALLDQVLNELVARLQARDDELVALRLPSGVARDELRRCKGVGEVAIAARQP